MILKYYSKQLDGIFDLKKKISNKINCENSQLKLLKIQTRDYLELLKKKAVLATSDVYFDLTAVVKEVFNFLSNQAT